MMNKPVLPPYQRHVLMCCGKSCGENLPLLNYLKKRVEEAGLLTGERAVRVNRAGCLGVCMQGPVMVVHPDGVWYCGLDEAAIDRIVDEHLQDGHVVAELVFHQAVT